MASLFINTDMPPWHGDLVDTLLERRLELKHNNHLNMFRVIKRLNILVF